MNPGNRIDHEHIRQVVKLFVLCEGATQPLSAWPRKTLREKFGAHSDTMTSCTDAIERNCTRFDVVVYLQL